MVYDFAVAFAAKPKRSQLTQSSSQSDGWTLTRITSRRTGNSSRAVFRRNSRHDFTAVHAGPVVVVVFVVVAAAIVVVEK